MSDKQLTWVFDEDGKALFQIEEEPENASNKTFDLMTGEVYDGNIPKYIWYDKTLFDNETKEKYLSLPRSERTSFVINLLDQFYIKNPEYTNFIKVKIYQDPMILLDFMRGIKKSHFKKCDVKELGRWSDLQKRIEEAEKNLALNPIDFNKLSTMWPIFRLRDLFTETELAAFYYLQNPRTENALEELINDYSSVYNLPFGAWLFTADEAIAHAAANRGFYDLTKTGKKKNDRHKAVEIRPVKNGFELVHTKKGNTNAVTIINKDLIQSTAAMKLLCFLLAKAAQQNYNPVIYFSLQELVNIGMYSNITNARAGFKNHILAVQSLQIAGEMKKGKKNIKQAGGVIFYNYKIDQNNVAVSCNENFDLKFLASYYTMLPAWSWTLSDNAFEVLLYAFMKSRTERSNHFNIGLQLIRDKLVLPTKEEYAAKGKKFNAGQFVKKPIIAAIDDIMNAIETNKDGNINIKPHYIINDKSLDEWLNGYIEVNVTGNYAETLKEIRNNQTKIIEANTRRKEAARAMVEAQKEAEKNDSKK